MQEQRNRLPEEGDVEREQAFQIAQVDTTAPVQDRTGSAEGVDDNFFLGPTTSWSTVVFLFFGEARFVSLLAACSRSGVAFCSCVLFHFVPATMFRSRGNIRLFGERFSSRGLPLSLNYSC